MLRPNPIPDTHPCPNQGMALRALDLPRSGNHVGCVTFASEDTWEEGELVSARQGARCGEDPCYIS